MDRSRTQIDDLPGTPHTEAALPLATPPSASQPLAPPDAAAIVAAVTGGLAPNTQAPTLRHMMQGEH